MKKLISTKDAIFAAAVSLFNDHGFDGTSVRDIAGKADVNPATISYYFKGKQGLLEACFTHFFEPYLRFLEEETSALPYIDAEVCLKRAVYKLLKFQSENHQLTRFIWREVSIDSQVVREIIASYLMKERFYLKCLFEKGMMDHSFKKQPVNFLIIQLKSMLTFPFLNSQQLREVWQLFPQEFYFVDHYYQQIDQWIRLMLVEQRNEPFEKEMLV
ncbi:TetR family transcriptional regulator [Rossellomorea marisflavi]|uniref:forespore capture DNA-binding protein RefZ n=1 Tax=Rossellomorea marisflavi TaxID=189381 RepID=UPI0025C9DD26|nr:forespore capture DNA-binding protein RefZ [Rossellomorea marisflavi]UTE74087.1 forespore capture DNA-binding protein RefZ [Rossellomorea marisflavi]GLI83759.1 TetR family transcriptional regulator [Rossellomorea marisflavi]